MKRPETRSSAEAGAARRRVPPDVLAVLAAIVLIVLAFGASSVYVERELGPTETRAARVADDVLPAIGHLSSLRSELRDLQRAASDALDGAAIDARAIERDLAETHAALAGYVALRAPGDADRLAAALRKIDADVARVRGALTGSRVDRDALAIALRDDVGDADAEAVRLVDRDTAIARDDMARLASLRRRAKATAWLLDGACVLVAIVAAALALRTTRRAANLTQARANALEEFANRAAHDLRGPMSPALLALQRAKREHPEGTPLRALLDRGERGLRNAEKVLDALHEFARAGARPAPDAAATLRDAIDAVADEVRPTLAAKGGELRVASVPDVAAACAPGVLLCILSNLVGNAVKYLPPEGERRVEVRAALRGRAVHVDVEDTGPGLAPESVAVVFEPYVRANTNRAAGLGLGLATVKRLVEAHHGALGVVSRVGRGSTFWFELPTAR